MRDLKTGSKIFVLILIFSIFMGAIGLMGYLNLEQANKRTQSMYQDRLLKIKWLNAARASALANEASVYKMMLSKIKAQQDIAQREIVTRFYELNLIMQDLKGAHLDLYEQEALQSLADLFDSYRSDRQEIINLAIENKTGDAIALHEQTENKLVEINQLLDQLANYNAEIADQINQDNQELAVQSTNILVIIISAAVGISLIVGIAITRLITKPLSAIVLEMSEVAKGNLSIQKREIKAKDEIGKLGASLYAMVNQLHQLITRVKSTTAVVSTSSEQFKLIAEETSKVAEELAFSLQEIAVGADDQTKRTEESNQAIEEMVAGIRSIADTSLVVTEASNTTAKEATQGNELIHNAIDQMKTIQQSVIRSAKVVELLGKRSEEIEAFVHVITDIAAQTNMLSLNASIEAARAGVHGKGFAVVAEEVRKLAEQSRNSANQITSLILDIQKETLHAVEAMREGTTEVESGMNLVKEAEEAFNRIMTSTQNVAVQINEVSTSVEDLFINSKEVETNLLEMTRFTRDTAMTIQTVASASQQQLATVEEIVGSAETLYDSANELDQNVDLFKVD